MSVEDGGLNLVGWRGGVRTQVEVLLVGSVLCVCGLLCVGCSWEGFYRRETIELSSIVDVLGRGGGVGSITGDYCGVGKAVHALC